MGYALPGNTSYVSCSWKCHKDRTPPSSEPGTDYATAYGSPLFAVESGVVTYIKTDPGTATGRYIEYRLDDGRTTRSLHLAEVWVKPGQRVTRGQQIGKCGASGYGNNWYYGPHVHQTLWPGAAWAAPTIDFATYVGAPAGGGGTTPFPPTPKPPEEEDDMAGNTGFYYTRSSDKAVVYGIMNPDSGFFTEWSGVGGSYNNGMAAAFRTGSFVSITQSHRNALYNSATLVRPVNTNAALQSIAAAIDDDDAKVAVSAQSDAPEG